MVYVQPGLADGVPAQGRGVDGFQGPCLPSLLYDSIIS